MRDDVLPACQRIVLAGFMGSGKSTVGSLLAEALHWNFVDLDDVVVQREGATIADIFANRGEAAFREMEEAALQEALLLEKTVIALGGGAAQSTANQQRLRESAATLLVYLAAPCETLLARCAAQAAAAHQPVRPLLHDHATAEQLFVAREPVYRALAHLSIETEKQWPEETAQAVMQHVNARMAHE